MTVSVPPAGALATTVPLARLSETSRDIGDTRIAFTAVVPPCVSVTVTFPPATLSGALHPPPRTLTAPVAATLSTHVNENDFPSMPLLDDLQISIVPRPTAAWAGRVKAPAATEPTVKMGSSNRARRPRGLILGRIDCPPLADEITL